MKPLTKKEQAIILHAKEAYRRAWKYNCPDFDKLDDNAAGVPISGIIRAYNSLLLQPNPYFGAELNYYKTFRSAYDCAFETADYSAQTEAIGSAFDDMRLELIRNFLRIIRAVEASFHSCVVVLRTAACKGAEHCGYEYERR